MLRRRTSEVHKRTSYHRCCAEYATGKAAISTCEKGQQHQQASHLLRVMQRHVSAPIVIPYNAAISASGASRLYIPGSDAAPCHCAQRDHLQRCHRACSTSRPYVSYGRCSAISWCSTWLPATLPVVHARASSSCRPYISYERCSAMPLCRRG